MQKYQFTPLVALVALLGPELFGRVFLNISWELIDLKATNQGNQPTLACRKGAASKTCDR